MGATNPPVILQETLGTKLRRAIAEAPANDPWAKPYMKAAPPWQPNTAFTLHQVVVNGGNIYTNLFSTGSSASSGGPTGNTAAVISDGTTAWEYYGQNNVTSDPTMTILTWAATTAYTLGQIIQTTTGAMYACVAGGTSASSAPTATTNSVTDGTVTWTYYGIFRTNPYLSIFPTVTVQSGAFGGITDNTYRPLTTVGSTVYNLKGCYLGASTDSGFSAPAYCFTPTTGNPTPVSQQAAQEFYTSGQLVAFYVGAGNIGVTIDGVKYSLQPTDHLNGNNSWTLFDFSKVGGRKQRKWRFEQQNTGNFGIIAVETTAQVWAPAISSPLTIMHIADSISAGSAFGPWVTGNNVAMHLQWQLGVTQVWPFVQGGTGWVNVGPGPSTNTFGYRIPEALTRNPDLWIFAGSINDRGTISSIAPAVTAGLSAIRTAGNTAPIIMVGCWPVNDSAQPAGAKNSDIENAILAGITAFNDPLGLTFWIPVANDPVLPPVTGTWNNSADINSSNGTIYINNSDATHPPDPGTMYWANWMANKIATNVVPLLR